MHGELVVLGIEVAASTVREILHAAWIGHQQPSTQPIRLTQMLAAYFTPRRLGPAR